MTEKEKQNRIRKQVHELLNSFMTERVDHLIDKMFKSGGIDFEETDLNVTHYRTAKTITCVLSKVLYNDYWSVFIEEDIKNLFNRI
jgi:hypothetical protein